MHLSKEETDLLVAAIPAAATIVVVLATAWTAYLATKRADRRKLYGEATKAAVGWQEMLYRVRRRSADEDRALINQFHDLQDQITYYGAWVGSESKHMKRSYDLLVAAVKASANAPIADAWTEVRPVPGNARDDDEHPDVSAATDAFLRDVRAHLSPWQVRKLSVVWRNRDRKSKG